MRRKTFRFLIASIIILFVVCIFMFMWMTRRMKKENESTMSQVCDIYMSEMINQMEDHFNSIINFQLSRTEGIIRRYPPEEVAQFGSEEIAELKRGGEIREYPYLALYSPNGELEVLYGEPLAIVNERPFYDALKAGNQKIGSAVDAEGNIYMILGVNAAYPMSNGKRSMALIAAIHIEKLSEVISTGSEENLVYTHIIRSDGSFVLKGAAIEKDNYYEWMSDDLAYVGATPEEIVGDLRQAISEKREYSFVVVGDEQRRNAYCMPLDKTEWFLVMVMQHGKLDIALDTLGNRHVSVAVSSCILIMAALLIVYFAYFKLSLNWMQALSNAQIHAEEASRAKSEFLSNMSHDIRTPMNGIIGMTTIAMNNKDKPEVVLDCLKKITLSSKHLLGLINDVLDMSKIESGKLTLNVDQVSLQDTMAGIVSMVLPLIKEKNLKFDVIITDISCEQIMCDGVRLNQVLMNLLSNAIKFTPEGGAITIKLSQEESQKGENYVRIHFWVKDTGIGMTPEFQKKIFEAFVREDNKRVQRTEGSGLGMAITKYIVDRMEGQIEVESELGSGSEFHLILDMQKANIEENAMSLPEWDVLVVDDDLQTCQGTVGSLKQLGVAADGACSGEEALEKVKERHESGKDYEIVLLDWLMPDKNGVETAKELRGVIGKDVPILLMSAYDSNDIEEEAKEAGVSGFLSKPLFRSTLYYGLKNAMGEQDEVAESVEEAPFDGTNRRILVAEDYDMNWDIIDTLLGDLGFTLERAENGRVCVDKFTASEEGYYDAILMDLRMPVLDGFGATKEIRACGRGDANLPIIAMTADAFTEDINHCLQCGMNSHVAKPIDMNQLLNILKKLLQDSPANASLNMDKVAKLTL